MNLYKEGDICYGVSMPASLYNYMFMVCTIEVCYPHCNFEDGTSGPGYRVLWRVPGGKIDRSIIGERHLRLRRPLVDKSDWNTLIGICKIDFRKGIAK